MSGEGGIFTHPTPKFKGREKDIHVNSHDISDDVMNNNCFNSSHQSTLHKIDPDIHYLKVNNCPIDTPYYSEQLLGTHSGIIYIYLCFI